MDGGGISMSDACPPCLLFLDTILIGCGIIRHKNIDHINSQYSVIKRVSFVLRPLHAVLCALLPNPP